MSSTPETHDDVPENVTQVTPGAVAEQPSEGAPATPEETGAPVETGAPETTEAADTSVTLEDPAPATPGVSDSNTSGSGNDDLVREGGVAADFLESLLDIADLDGDLEVDIEGDRAAVAIVDSEDGAAPRRLVGADGEVLEALQELTRLAVQAETGERSRLMLDVAGYRADRRGALVDLATLAIAEVKKSGARRELEPMTAFERKVVHDQVLAAGLQSSSAGAEPARYVVIEPAD